jgi:hypothetical protein
MFLLLEGTPLEVFYALMTFGITRTLLPVGEDGNLIVDHHNDWIATRMKQEKTDTADIIIIVPGPKDVLMGRGKIIEENLGNLRLRHLIATHGEQYDNACKFEKTVAAQSIMGMIKDQGGRFLKKGPGGWREVSDEMARDKVSHAFRNKRGRLQKPTQVRIQKTQYTEWIPPPNMHTTSTSQTKRLRHEIAY